MTSRSPIRLRCSRPFASYGDPMAVCKWSCDDERIQGALFEYRRDPKFKVVLHRSTREPGRWQATWFDERGPGGDVNRDTAAAALYDQDVTDTYRLVRVTLRDGTTLGKRERRTAVRPKSERHR